VYRPEVVVAFSNCSQRVRVEAAAAHVLERKRSSSKHETKLTASEERFEEFMINEEGGAPSTQNSEVEDFKHNTLFGTPTGTTCFIRLEGRGEATQSLPPSSFC